MKKIVTAALAATIGVAIGSSASAADLDINANAYAYADIAAAAESISVSSSRSRVTPFAPLLKPMIGHLPGMSISINRGHARHRKEPVRLSSPMPSQPLQTTIEGNAYLYGDMGMIV